MKAKPLIFNDEGSIQVSPDKATHIMLKLPGPTQVLFLPVMIKGTREGTRNWTWNGSTEKPTLKPSVLVQSGHLAPGFKPADSCWCKYYASQPDEEPVFHCFRCHTWITDGQAQFLPDSTHELTGKTLDLLEVE